MTSECHLAQHKYSFDGAMLFDVPALLSSGAPNVEAFIYLSKCELQHKRFRKPQMLCLQIKKCPLKNVC